MLTQATRDLIAAAQLPVPDPAEDEPEDPMLLAVRAFLAAVKKARPEDVHDAMRRLADHFDHRTMPRAGVLARACGSLVESGRDPQTIAEPLTRELARLFPAAAELADLCLARMPAVPAPSVASPGPVPDDADDDDDDDGDHRLRDEIFEDVRAELAPEHPALNAAWEALEGLRLPAIAVYSASTPARAAARPLRTWAGRISEHSETGFWLDLLLSVLDDEPIVVIEPATRLGILARISGVVDVFQLHVLLMDAFPARGWFPRRRIPRHVADIARGDGPPSTESVEGAWNLYAWGAVRPDRTLPAPDDHASNHFWIWNELMPEHIPVFEGRRAVLLGPASYRRFWEADRRFHGLRAELAVERTLSPDEVDGWLARMAEAAARVA